MSLHLFLEIFIPDICSYYCKTPREEKQVKKVPKFQSLVIFQREGGWYSITDRFSGSFSRYATSLNYLCFECSNFLWHEHHVYFLQSTRRDLHMRSSIMWQGQPRQGLELSYAGILNVTSITSNACGIKQTQIYMLTSQIRTPTDSNRHKYIYIYIYI